MRELLCLFFLWLPLAAAAASDDSPGLLALAILRSDKCLGGRCTVALARDRTDKQLYEIAKIAGKSEWEKKEGRLC